MFNKYLLCRFVRFLFRFVVDFPSWNRQTVQSRRSTTKLDGKPRGQRTSFNSRTSKTFKRAEFHSDEKPKTKENLNKKNFRFFFVFSSNRKKKFVSLIFFCHWTEENKFIWDVNAAPDSKSKRKRKLFRSKTEKLKVDLKRRPKFATDDQRATETVVLRSNDESSRSTIWFRWRPTDFSSLRWFGRWSETNWISIVEFGSVFRFSSREFSEEFRRKIYASKDRLVDENFCHNDKYLTKRLTYQLPH